MFPTIYSVILSAPRAWCGHQLSKNHRIRQVAASLQNDGSYQLLQPPGRGQKPLLL